ncbi:tRNA-dependent cyclodipeptide synthase [Streptomyces sp. NPDC005955]|uniref:tRNA-dependent cyclodipeptide synthase n=1 Tax=Streptomyces sp. NPDC005955 TaxID=3364738 RepID=UPI0036C5CC53
MFEVMPLTRTCQRVLERGDHALIGVSTGNSYFSQERLGALLVWAEQHFSLVDVLYIDTHIDAMLVATGLPPAQARRRTKGMLKDVRRRIRRALEMTSGAEHGRIRVHPLSAYEGLPQYETVLRRIEPDLGVEGSLMGSAQAQVRDLLVSHVPGPTEPVPVAAQMQAGLAYLRAELPFLLDTPAILDVPSSVTCYHKLMPVAQEMFVGLGALSRNPRQGFLVVRPAPQRSADRPRPPSFLPRRPELTLTEQYDEIASDYTDVERVFSTYRSLIEVPSLTRALGPVDGATVLDVGCGSGTYSRLLRRRGAERVLGVDLSARMVDVARRLEERDPLGVRYEVHDAVDMPVLGAFDAVVAVAVLHYADSRPTLARMLERIRANLVPGGRFVAFVGNPRLPADTAQMNGLVVHRPQNARDGDPSPLTIPTTPPTTLPARYWSCEAIEWALQASGFGEVVWEPLDGLPPGIEEPVNLLVSARAVPVGSPDAGEREVGTARVDA